MPARRTLARRLESVADFESPTPELEQYLTPPELAAHLCHLAGLQGDLTDETVVDLGTGTGMLAIGAALWTPARVVGVDVDSDALELARMNENRVRVTDSAEGRGGDTAMTPIDWVRGDVTAFPLRFESATVLSNPPFGAQHGNRHADRAFLEAIRPIADVSYTIHNEGSKSFLESFTRDEGATITHAFRAAFPIPRRFSFHTSASETLEAEVFRIEW